MVKFEILFLTHVDIVMTVFSNFVLSQLLMVSKILQIEPHFVSFMVFLLLVLVQADISNFSL